MKFCNKEEAVRKMNRLGLSGRPFIFVVDYKQEQVWVVEPDAVDPEEDLEEEEEHEENVGDTGAVDL